MAYIWILSSNPCSECVTLSSDTYPSKPQRPHKFCQCTFVQVTSSSGGSGSGCADKTIRITSMTRTNVEVDYSGGEEEDYTDNHLIHEWEVHGICPDGSEVEVNVTVQIEGQELHDRVKGLYKEWEEGGDGSNAGNALDERTSSEARTKALAEMENKCPPCKPPIVG